MVSEKSLKTTDGSAYLRSIHHLDGNVKYANYMNAGQMTDYLSQHGHLGSIGSALVFSLGLPSLAYDFNAIRGHAFV